MKCRFIQALALLPALALFAPAQDADLQEDLRFVQALRGEHYFDQALRYIDRLEKERQKELPPVGTAGDARFKAAPDKTPAEKADQRRLEAAVAQAKLDLAVNLLDQAVTYPDIPRGNYRALRAQKVEEAQKAFQPLTSGDRDSPYTWMAQAYVARCTHELGETPKAREQLERVLGVTAPGAPAGKRLAS